MQDPPPSRDLRSALRRSIGLALLLGGLQFAAPARADDLSYIDERLPFTASSAEERLDKAIACSDAGDGRCYLFIVAELLRSFRNETGPLPKLEAAKMSYYIYAAGRWGMLRRQKDNYAFLADAIYYSHKSCFIEDLFGASGAISDINSVDVGKCSDDQCRADLEYYLRHVKDYIRKTCL